MAVTPLRFAIVGLSGYARVHAEAVQWLQSLGLARLTAVVARAPDRLENAEQIDALQTQGVQLFGDFEELLHHGNSRTDVVTLPVGIYLHAEMSVAALEAGLHVYCEKPAAATPQEVQQMKAVQRRTGRKLVIGFQHLYSPSVQTLQARISDGRLGPLRRATLLHAWPRSVAYYRRNDWAGKLKLGDRWVLDSPANNAMAHYLLNVLYLAEPDPQRVARPAEMQAELYRVNPIESTDLTQLRVTTDTRVEAFATLTHASTSEIGPALELTFERGRALWLGDDGHTTVWYRYGTSERFSNDAPRWRFAAFRDLVDAIREDREPFSTPERVLPHALAIQAMHESCPEIRTVPDAWVREEQARECVPPYRSARFRRVRDLDRVLKRAFEARAFFSELDVPWAAANPPLETQDFEKRNNSPGDF